MRWQIRGLNAASRNIQDGISYCNVAEGALSEIHSILDRMKELSVQAANDTNTDIDSDADTNTDAINEQDNCSTSNSTKDTLDNIYCLLDILSESELIEVLNYIEKRVKHDN